MTIRTVLAFTAALALAACTQSSDGAGGAPAPSETVMPVEPDGGIGDGAGPPEGGAPMPAATPHEASFPQAMRGTWRRAGDGPVTAALCDNSVASNMGKVLTVRAERYGYFETGGSFIEVRDRNASSVDALFDTTYADEPTRAEIRFDLRDNGKTLRLSPYEGSASKEPEYYERCPGA